MDNAHKPTFSVVTWIILGGIYIFSLWWFGVTVGNGFQVFLDLVVFLLGISLWKFFFSQFILPVLTLENRKKISQRLRTGSDGPALFIENGRIIESGGERDKSGKGVILLDTASAVVLKKLTHFTQTAGPGVVFTEEGESIAEAVGLHNQSDSIGPKAKENPFASQNASQPDDQYTAIQERRFETSALTRDGIEVIPNISINFKIDASPAEGKESGSRFGFDEDAVRKAIWHTAINPDVSSSRRQRKVSWNQLPVYLVADLWREYLSKYKFEELFQATQDIPPYKKKYIEEEDISLSPLDEEIQEKEYSLRGIIFDFYKELNRISQKISKGCNEALFPRSENDDESTGIDDQSDIEVSEEGGANLGKETALEAIRRMINQRLKEPYYDKVDAYGKTQDEQEKSKEYFFLKEERGIRVLNASVHALRFDDELEKKFEENWTTNWFDFAKKEAGFIKKEKEIRVLQGKEKAHFEYAQALSREVVQGNLKDTEELLSVLLQGTRKEIVRNHQLLSQVDHEIEDIVDLMQWIGKGEKDGR